MAITGKLPAAPEELLKKELSDDIDRIAFKSSVQVPLLDAARMTDDPEMLYHISCAYNGMDYYSDVCESVIRRHEARGQWDRLRLLQRQLSGMMVSISPLVSKRPDRPCSAFKAREMNRVISEVKALAEEEMGVSLSLVSEAGEHTNSDAFFSLQACADVCACFARRHFNGTRPAVPPNPVPLRIQQNHEEILEFCRDEPRSALEIMDRLGFRDKKTIRKYLKPLLENGWLERTVPDRPHSRNQKYLASRFA